MNKRDLLRWLKKHGYEETPDHLDEGAVGWKAYVNYDRGRVFLVGPEGRAASICGIFFIVGQYADLITINDDRKPDPNGNRLAFNGQPSKAVPVISPRENGLHVSFRPVRRAG